MLNKTKKYLAALFVCFMCSSAILKAPRRSRKTPKKPTPTVETESNLGRNLALGGLALTSILATQAQAATTNEGSSFSPRIVSRPQQNPPFGPSRTLSVAPPSTQSTFQMPTGTNPGLNYLARYNPATPKPEDRSRAISRRYQHYFNIDQTQTSPTTNPETSWMKNLDEANREIAQTLETEHETQPAFVQLFNDNLNETFSANQQRNNSREIIQLTRSFKRNFGGTRIEDRDEQFYKNIFATTEIIFKQSHPEVTIIQNDNSTPIVDLNSVVNFESETTLTNLDYFAEQIQKTTDTKSIIDFSAIFMAFFAAIQNYQMTNEQQTKTSRSEQPLFSNSIWPGFSETKNLLESGE